MTTLVGSLKETAPLADCPGLSIAPLARTGTGFAPFRVTPAVRLVIITASGPVTVLLVLFVTVTVPLKVAVRRLKIRPLDVTGMLGGADGATVPGVEGRRPAELRRIGPSAGL